MSPRAKNGGFGVASHWWSNLAALPPSPATLTWVVAGLGSYGLIAGLVTLLGWMTGLVRLTDWEGNGITMKANTAVASALTGAALILLARRSGAISCLRSMALAVMLLGGLTLVEHFTAWDLKIDTLLFDEAAGAKATAAPGRMGVPASTSFLLLGSAILLLTRGVQGRRLAVYFGGLAAAIATLSLTGHFYGADVMFSIPRLTGIAWQTATILFALSLGVIGCAPDHHPMRLALDPGSAGILIRRIVPILIIIPFCLGWMRVWIQEEGLVDTAFGTALRTVTEVGLLLILLWSIAKSVHGYERALSENRELLRTTLESIGEGVITTDRNGQVSYLNPVAEHLTGWNKSEAAEVPLPDVWNVINEATRRPLTDHAINTLRISVPHGQTYAALLVSRSGVERPIDVTTAPLRDEKGLAIGSVLVFRDATSRRKAELDLRTHAANLEQRVKERTAELRSSNEQLEAFVYSIAHDLRAPLRTMASFSELLTQDHRDQLDETGRDFLHRIKEGAQFMDRLLIDLLAYGRTSQAEMILEKVDLQKALDSACAQLSSQIFETKTTIEFRGPFPPVSAHEATLIQCVVNLLNNSMKFMPPGVTPQIAISFESIRTNGAVDEMTRTSPDKVRFWFSDNGIGIAPEHQERAFRVFERLYGNRYPGTGIGLSIVRKGIERMGGQVGVVSAKGQGSRFWIELVRNATEIPKEDGSVGSTNTKPPRMDSHHLR